MSTLTELELREIINSDMKLWEEADTSPYELGDGKMGLAKTLTLPYGIGEQTVVFPSNDLSAVSTYGSTIRSMVDDHRSEEAVAVTSTRGQDGGSALPDEPQPEHAVSTAQAVSTLEEPYEAGAGLDVRADGLRRAINDAETKVRRWRKELRALDAALEIMNAPEDDEAECESVYGEEEG